MIANDLRSSMVSIGIKRERARKDQQLLSPLDSVHKRFPVRIQPYIAAQRLGFARLPYTVPQNVLRNENIAFSVHLHFKGWHTIKCQVQSSYQLDLEDFIPPSRLRKVFAPRDHRQPSIFFVEPR